MEPKIDNLRNQLKVDVEKSNWGNILTPFIESKAFDEVVDSLVSLVNSGKRFTPKFKDVFNAFKECDYNDLKVVIVGQDPYPQLGSADGLAFSCSKKGKAEKSLQYINKAIDTDHTDLRCWANQGVLLINTALTVEINKIGSHFWNWKPFTEYLFTELNKNNKDIVFILMGRKAEAWQLLLSNQKLLKCSHPASAAYRGGIWDSNDVFSKANQELERQGKTCIVW
tara:strand:+ start:224 stop:898 length:675 start_codon:yes stop_codon:yes gene_type:complete